MRLLLGAALTLVACRSTAPSGLTLLFHGRSPAATLGGLSWAPDPDHSRIVGFDRELRVARQFTGPRLAKPLAVAALDGRYLLVTDWTGDGVVFDTAGRAVREWASPAMASLYAAAGRHIVAARSPYFVQFGAEPDTAPLVWVLDTLGRPIEGIASVRVPVIPFLAQVANAGAVAVDPAGAVYFAPLTRDEIRKYDRGGQVRWTARRGLPARDSEPELLPVRGRTFDARYAIVNVALVLGPDGRLYALGSDDSAGTRLRVDVVDTASGTILATRRLGPLKAAIAVDRGGRLWVLDAHSLLAGAGVRRQPFAPAFALPDLHGDTVTLADYAGKVTLVNFWASWCDPCRDEFPHMAELYRRFERKDFDIAAVSDDVDRGKMLAFVREFRPPFPILAGGGKMKQTYYYRGLPYSVLLDRHGRIIERIFGFGGAAEFRRLHETIAKEIAAP
jgi:thiol-disulfide isomerase/thioredoxin